MNLPFDPSPLDADGIVACDIIQEGELSVAYITYKSKERLDVPSSWNIRRVISMSEAPLCSFCGSRYHSPYAAACLVCGNFKRSHASVEEETQGKPNLHLNYFEKINAKDKLTSIGGRACLVLGTTEAANDTESPTTKVHRLILLSFYDFYQDAASVKYEILQFFYYDSSTGRMFIDKKLNELNKLLWTETIEHNFAIVPQWNVAKICEIYLNRSV